MEKPSCRSTKAKLLLGEYTKAEEENRDAQQSADSIRKRMKKRWETMTPVNIFILLSLARS